MIEEGFPNLGVCFVWRGMLRDEFCFAASLSIHSTLPPIVSCGCLCGLTSLTIAWLELSLSVAVIICSSFIFG